jgi:hypothetical protein
VLRQASASLKINRSNTTRLLVPIANCVCPRDLGAIHKCDLFIGKRKSRVNVGYNLQHQQIGYTAQSLQAGYQSSRLLVL